MVSAGENGNATSAVVIDFNHARKIAELNQRAEEEAPENPVRRLWWYLTHLFGNSEV